MRTWLFDPNTSSPFKFMVEPLIAWIDECPTRLHAGRSMLFLRRSDELTPCIEDMRRIIVVRR
jgi:hypothetical protein